MKQQENNQAVSTHNLMDTSSVLQVRLDSAPILIRIKTYLTGKVQEVVYDEESKPYVREEKIAEPKANDEGVHWIINFCENIINPQTVQGNFQFAQFERYLDEIHDDLLTNLMINMGEWGISETDYEPICDTIMAVVIPFVSRLIDNKERDSYAQSIQVKEASTVNQSKGLF